MVTASVSDAQLVQRAREGDRPAFDALVGRHFDVAFAIARARLDTHEAAEDLAQEVFLRAWLSLASLRDGSQFGGWIARMTRNLAIDWQRRGQRRSALLPMTGPDAEAAMMQAPDPAQPDPRETLAHTQETALLHDALARLAPEEREVLMLHHLHGLTKSDIARRLGIHPATAARQLDRATAALRACFEERVAATLRPMAPPRPEARAHACAAVAAAAAMPPAAKAALVAAAQAAGPVEANALAVPAGGIAAAIESFLTSITGATAQGVAVMGAVKIISAGAVVAVVATGSWWALSGHASSSSDAAPGTSGIAARVGRADGPRVVPQSIAFSGERRGLLRTGESVAYAIADHPDNIRAIEFTALADGNLQIRVWHKEDGAPQVALLGPGQDMTSIPFSAVRGLALFLHGDPVADRMVCESLQARPTGDGIEYNWFLSRKAGVAPKGDAIFREYAAGRISQSENAARLTALLDESSMLPTDTAHRAAVAEAIRKFKP